MRVNEQPRLFKAVLYMLVTLILIEVLRPIMFLTSSGYLSMFILFIGGTFLLNLLKIPALPRYAIKLFMMIGALTYMYHGESSSIVGTIRMILQQLVVDVPILLTKGFYAISNETRTFLFFILLWMIAYLIRYWIEVKQRILLFYMTLILFVATVDTFTAYDASRSIYIILLLGFLLLGLLALGNVLEKYKMKVTWTYVGRMFLPLVIMLVVSGALINALPIYGPLLPDPVPFIQKTTGINPTSQTAVSKAGYGTDDTQLGGPFLEDASLVFEAEVRQRQYWKVETKDTYTSKGWEQSADTRQQTFSLNEPFRMLQNEEQVEQANIRMVEQYPFIPYPYELVSVDAERPVSLTYHEDKQQFTTTLNEQRFPLDQYSVQFETQTYSLQQLRDTSMDQLVGIGGMEPYLQLPESLPTRVSDLAISITDSSESVYEKAKAIEQYFKDEQFVYDRSDVAVPGEGEDYVDQFLFDTQKGYCDNFSSSMVVMLRAIDIPARWVKGFAPGELIVDEEGNRTYRISNDEAHSWVEAYMPGIGWVPFEPTIGFTGNTQVENDLFVGDEESLDSEVPEEDIKEPLQEEQEESTDEQEKEVEEEDQKAPAEQQESKTEKVANWLLYSIIAVLLLLSVAFILRKKWWHHYLIYRLRKADGSWSQFERQYNALLKQLARFDVKRSSEETLTTYAKRVDEQYGTENMQKLTKIYEQGIYGNVREIGDWQRLQQLWEEMMTRISN